MQCSTISPDKLRRTALDTPWAYFNLDGKRVADDEPWAYQAKSFTLDVGLADGTQAARFMWKVTAPDDNGRVLRYWLVDLRGYGYLAQTAEAACHFIANELRARYWHTMPVELN